MAVATAIAGAGLALSAYQTVDSAIDAKKAQDKIDAFKPQELVNANKNIQLSTLKSEQQTKANNINVATSVDALQRGGTRAILGGIPKINEGSILLQNQISQDLERQDRERDILIARGEERIQDIQERREREALQGLGQELNVANQNFVTGLGDMASSGLALSDSLGAKKPKVKTASTLNEVGLDQIVPPTNPLFSEAPPILDTTLNRNKIINPLTGLPYFDQQGMMFQSNDRR